MNSKRILTSIVHFLKPARTIPHTSWTAKNRWAVTPKNAAVLFFGLAIFGLGESLLIQSTIGNSPWVVFAQGLSLQTKLSIGQSTALISIAVLLLWWPLEVCAAEPLLAKYSSAYLCLFWNNLLALTRSGLPIPICGISATVKKSFGTNCLPKLFCKTSEIFN